MEVKRKIKLKKKLKNPSKKNIEKSLKRMPIHLVSMMTLGLMMKQQVKVNLKIHLRKIAQRNRMTQVKKLKSLATKKNSSLVPICLMR